MLSASSRESLQKVMDDLIPRVRCVISMINATSDPAYHCKDRDHFVSLRGKHLTSSSANADRPRDTLCLSAVCFNTSSAILLVTSASHLPRAGARTPRTPRPGGASRSSGASCHSWSIFYRPYSITSHTYSHQMCFPNSKALECSKMRFFSQENR